MSIQPEGMQPDGYQPEGYQPQYDPDAVVAVPDALEISGMRIEPALLVSAVRFDP